MLATFRQNSKIERRSLWCFVEYKLRDEERSISRCTSRNHRQANNLSRSSRLIQKRRREKVTNQFWTDSLNCFRCRESQINIGWNEEHCARYDAIAAEDHSHIATASERFRRENAWVLVLDSSGPHGPMNQREDDNEAIKMKERLFEESRQR